MVEITRDDITQSIEFQGRKRLTNARSVVEDAADELIELFFKWIKQHLRIKAFYGTSPNAVKTQIWIALSTYLLIAIIRKRLYLELPLYTILQVLSVSLFEKTPILRAFQDMDYITQNSDIHKQLMLFD